MKALAAAFTSVAVLFMGTAPSASAATYTLLKQSSKNGVTARLWLNNQTRAIHAQGLGPRAGESARIDAYAGIILDQRIMRPGGGTTLDTKAFSIHPRRYSACAGSPAGGDWFICTAYYSFNG
ncbi:hypothetical protein [Nonomuraea guangzhouensis]|uniref:Uncharacterized protein n=1 Tax=Nonomuraea guangzhouensis TaxID=1291555 RepID=A0ABW4GL25_9ACTN|nr:hypothetical protein [Nonomuraea guangzhouensis]